MQKLAGGGAAVAEMIGARAIAQDTRDPLERRLLNVVEEMAIAAGIRVPAVYVMDREKGINAFAAGFDVSNTVVAVTGGALQVLTRDELQGVIGHEFSHILNGDIRLNISMIGVLAGILFLSAIGGFMMRNASGKEAVPVFSLGLALFIVGYVGLFFGRIIKAAVSRQREFLADASSVQFTRNPGGIAGALDQIRSSTALIQSRRAEDLSHMFFGQGIDVFFEALFDTHPPIEERIQRVYPGFQPAAYRPRRPRAAPAAEAQLPVEAVGFAAPGRGPFADQDSRRSGDLAGAWRRSPKESAGLVGVLNAANVDFASQLLAELPMPLREQVRDAEGARAALIALLFAPDDEVMKGQVEALESTGLGALAERAKSCVPLTRPLRPAFHLPVIDLALPALRSSSDKVKMDLLAALYAVIQADRRVSLHEFVVYILVQSQLAKPTPPRAPRYNSVTDVREDALRVLRLAMYAGAAASGSAEAFAEGAAEMGLEDTGGPGHDSLSLKDVRRSLEKLKDLTPLAKAELIKGLFAAVTADGKIRVAEAEVMRLVGAVLDCPLPPLLESLDPDALVA
jgi:Zn-dependent protease with chaperone function